MSIQSHLELRALRTAQDIDSQILHPEDYEENEIQFWEVMNRGWDDILILAQEYIKLKALVDMEKV